MADHTPYQKKIIKRYYDNLDTIAQQRLADLTTEIYLAEGKKLERYWKEVEKLLTRMELPAARRDHILAQRDPKILAALVTELAAK